MEDLGLQTKVINLGKLLVEELGLERSTDTLSRWMAHYIAEKLALSERLPFGKEKDDSERDCFETILKLWKHRWLLPSGKRPLEDFEPILKVLEKLNPERPEPFHGRVFNRYLSQIEDNISNSNEINLHVDTALEIDKAARIWIDDILHRAALLAKGDNTEEFLKNSMVGGDDDDTNIIRIILDNDPSVTSKNYNEDSFEKKYKIEKLRKRVEDLEKFAKLNELLINNYKKELLGVQANL